MTNGSTPTDARRTDPGEHHGTGTGRRAASVLLTAVGLLAGGWLGVGLTRIAVTSSTLLVGTILEEDRLHDLGMRAVILDVSNSRLVSRLNQGPLRVTGDDVTRILHATFDADDTSAKAVEVHRGLVRFIREHTGEGVFRVSIAEERPVLTDSLGHLLLQQYAALPECGLGDDVSTLLSAARIRLFGGDGEEFFSEEHPDCRPPEVVASRVEEGLAEEIAAMTASGPDSVDAFPGEADDPGFAALAAHAQRGLAWSRPLLPLLLALLAVGGHVLLARRRRGVWPLAAVGVGLGLYGLVVLLVAPARIEAVFADVGTPGQASEIWAALGSYGLRRAVVLSGICSALAGLAVLGVAGATRLTGRR